MFKIQSIVVHYATQFLSTVRFPAHIRIPRSINYNETNQLTCERNNRVKGILRFHVQSDRWQHSINLRPLFSGILISHDTPPLTHYQQAQDSGFPLQMATVTNINTVIVKLKNSRTPTIQNVKHTASQNSNSKFYLKTVR